MINMSPFINGKIAKNFSFPLPNDKKILQNAYYHQTQIRFYGRNLFCCSIYSLYFCAPVISVYPMLYIGLSVHLFVPKFSQVNFMKLIYTRLSTNKALIKFQFW